MKLSEAADKMLVTISVLSLAFVAVAFIYYRSLSALPFAAGVTLMYGVNVLRVVMLDRASGDLAQSRSSAVMKRIGLLYLIRFILTGIVLAVAALTPYVSLLGAALGVVTWSVGVFTLKFFISDKWDRS